MPDWFCKIDGKVYGPYSGQALRQMAVEERLLPSDSLRDGADGEWFPAREMENLFPGAASAIEDDVFADDRPRKKKSKPSNYYQIVWQNLAEGGQWHAILGVTFGAEIVLGIIFTFLRGPFFFLFDRGGLLMAIITAMGAAVLILAFSFLVDVLFFGIPCVLMRVRLNPRRDSVLDVFSFSYLLVLAPKLFAHLVILGSDTVGTLLILLYPFVHAGVLAYLMTRFWGLSGSRSLSLAGIRFAYQTPVFVFVVANRFWHFV